MNKTGHYSALKWTLKKAGVSENDSSLIARASQFVDDATAWAVFSIPHEMIEKGLLEILDEEFFNKRVMHEDSIFQRGYALDPVCTAHKGLQHVVGITEDAQKKVYQCFHFSPTVASDPVVISGYTSIIYLYLEKMFERYMKDKTSYNAIAFGVALHTYCDTYSHYGFSGRLSDANKVSNVKKRNGEKLDLGYSMVPPIGHAQAGGFPDRMNLDWSFTRDGKRYQRSNIVDFQNAFYDIHFLINRDFFWYPVPKNISEMNKYYKPFKADEMEYYMFHQAAYYQRKFMMDFT